MSRILSQSEIKEITKRQRYSAQARALRSMGFEVKIRADGSPLVSESNFEKVMGGFPQTDKVDVKLNLEALHAPGKKQTKPRK